MPIYAYFDASGRLVEVYPDVTGRRLRQPLRKAGMRTNGRKTKADQRCGLGSYKGVK